MVRLPLNCIFQIFIHCAMAKSKSCVKKTQLWAKLIECICHKKKSFFPKCLVYNTNYKLLVFKMILVDWHGHFWQKYLLQCNWWNPWILRTIHTFGVFLIIIFMNHLDMSIQIGWLSKIFTTWVHNNLPQELYLWSFLPSWTAFIWFFKTSESENDLSQELHL